MDGFSRNGWIDTLRRVDWMVEWMHKVGVVGLIR